MLLYTKHINDDSIKQLFRNILDKRKSFNYRFGEPYLLKYRWITRNVIYNTIISNIDIDKSTLNKRDYAKIKTLVRYSILEILNDLVSDNFLSYNSELKSYCYLDYNMGNCKIRNNFYYIKMNIK